MYLDHRCIDNLKSKFDQESNPKDKMLKLQRLLASISNSLNLQSRPGDIE